MRKNLDIRIECLKSDVYLFEVADFLKYDRNDFYHILRSKELNSVSKHCIFEAIEIVCEAKNERRKRKNAKLE